MNTCIAEETLAELMARRRADLNIDTPEEAAERAEFGARHWRRMEKGESFNPEMKTVRQIAAVLQIGVEAVLCAMEVSERKNNS